MFAGAGRAHPERLDLGLAVAEAPTLAAPADDGR